MPYAQCDATGAILGTLNRKLDDLPEGQTQVEIPEGIDTTGYRIDLATSQLVPADD